MTLLRVLPGLVALVAFAGPNPVSGRTNPLPPQGDGHRVAVPDGSLAGGIVIAGNGQVPVVEGIAPLDDPAAEGAREDRANRVPTVEAVPRTDQPGTVQQPPPVQQPPMEP